MSALHSKLTPFLSLCGAQNWERYGIRPDENADNLPQFYEKFPPAVRMIWIIYHDISAFKMPLNE